MLDLNNLPVQPERYETEHIDSLFDERPELLTVSLMSKTERYFLNGLLRLYKPKRILEIGVNRGGGTYILLNAIQDISDATVTSIDIAESLRIDGVRHEVGEAVPPSLEKSRWTLITGKDPVEIIEELSGPFDFLVLDTAHLHPIESLNFLTAFPFMTEDAVVVLHDINHFVCSKKSFPQVPFACKLLFDTITARKLEPDEEEINGRANIGAFQLLPYTKDHIEDVFSMLSFPWGINVNQHSEFDVFFNKHYSAKSYDYYKKASEVSQNAVWYKNGYIPINLEGARIARIRDRFGEILKKKRFVFYGAGDAAEKLITYFKKHDIRLPDELWDIDATNKTGFDMPVNLPRFDTLNNDECGMLVTITYSKVIQEIYNKCEVAGFGQRINICVLFVLDEQGNELCPDAFLNKCEDVDLNSLDVISADRIDTKFEA